MMLVGPMKKKLVSTVVVVAVVLTAVFGAILYVVWSGQQSEIKLLQEKSETIQRYVFTKNFSAGHVIDTGDLQLAAVKAETTPDNSFPSYMEVTPENRQEIYMLTGTNYNQYESVPTLDLLVGRKLKINVSTNTTLTEEMLVAVDEEATDDLRLEEFAMITLPSDTNTGDYIDVRITFPTGEDFSVLTGKKVEKYTDNTVFLKLTEDDILTMGSAIVEAYMYDGTKIYATKYVDPFNQIYNHTKVDFVKEYQEGLISLIGIKETENLNELIAKLSEEKDADYLALVAEYPETYKEELAKRYEDEIKVDESEIELYEIAEYIGLTEYEIEQIQTALEVDDDETIERYRNKIVTTKKEYARTYPVKAEVLEVIKNNPHILKEVKDNFDTTAVINAEVQKYEKSLLEDEGAIEEAYDRIVEKVKEEVQLQKDERVKYLTTLISE